MNARYQLITFDVYSALFDIESSLVPVVEGEFGTRVDPLAFVRMWRMKQLDQTLISNSLGRGRVSFRTTTGRALDYAIARAQLDATEAVREAMVMAWDALQPWPEAEDVLRTVKGRGYMMALLSNGDLDMLTALAGRLSTPFDRVFASDHAGYYKPHPSVYALPLKALGMQPQEVLHVAGGSTDVLGAKSAGLPCAWSNRLGDLVLDPGLRADHEFSNLRGLLALI